MQGPDQTAITAAAAAAATAQLFIRAKRSPRCPWHVYVAAALMEWRAARERDVARRIFEKGLEVPEFGTTAEYVLAYARFLTGEDEPPFVAHCLRHICVRFMA